MGGIPGQEKSLSVEQRYSRKFGDILECFRAVQGIRGAYSAIGATALALSNDRIRIPIARYLR